MIASDNADYFVTIDISLKMHDAMKIQEKCENKTSNTYILVSILTIIFKWSVRRKRRMQLFNQMSMVWTKFLRSYSFKEALDALEAYTV